MLLVLVLSACTIDVDEPTESEADSTRPVVAAETDQPTAAVAGQTDADSPDAAPSTQTESNSQQPNPQLIPEPIPEPNSEVLLNESGIATSEAALAKLLATGYVVESNQVVPVTVWICTDVFEENRSYYFYDEGLLNPVRRVAIERTLISDDAFNDITFFWTTTGTDSVLLSSLIVGEDDVLVSSGQQYDISTIRFTEVDAKPVFSAQTLLRGNLTCATFDLR